MSTGLSEIIDGLRVRRHPRAKRMKLRYEAPEDRFVLTLPLRVSEKHARRWIEEQREWMDEQRARRAPGLPLEPRRSVPFEGGELMLVHEADRPRRIEREGQQLIGGGPVDGFARRVEQWLRRAARDRLAEDVSEFAGKAGVEVSGVAVGDARSRWGSCSTDGKLRFNWRLVCAPPEVRRYVAAHEVAHRRHMDHGRAFHALEEELFGGPTREARRQLRELGPGLQRIGR